VPSKPREFVTLDEAVDRLQRMAVKPVSRRFCRKMVLQALRSGKVAVREDGIELSLAEKRKLADDWERARSNEQ
jgi:hypothetical protein